MKFASILKSTASALAETIMLPKLTRTAPKADVTAKRGERGTPFSRYTQYHRTGPFYHQDGTKPDGRPRIRAYMVHTFLHPTKGWRACTDIRLDMVKAIRGREARMKALKAMAKSQPVNSSFPKGGLNRKGRIALGILTAQAA